MLFKKEAERSNFKMSTKTPKKEVTMETVCFTGNYRERFARVKEFSRQKTEVVLDEFLFVVNLKNDKRHDILNTSVDVKIG